MSRVPLPFVACVAVAFAANSHALKAQFGRLNVTATSSMYMGAAPVPCPNACDEFAFTHSVGLSLDDRFGIDYRFAKWGNSNGLQLSNFMRSHLLTLDYRVARTGRARPVVMAGFGKSDVAARMGEGGHAWTEYGPAHSLPTAFAGLSLDLRVYKHLAIIPMVSTTRTVGGTSFRQHCVQYNYVSGDFTPTCDTSPTSSQRYALMGLSLGVGIR